MSRDSAGHMTMSLDPTWSAHRVNLPAVLFTPKVWEWFVQTV